MNPHHIDLFFHAEELGGAGLWGDTIGHQYTRVLDASWALERDTTPPAYQRIRSEAFFLLCAIRQLIYIHEAYLRLATTDESKQRLCEARADFDRDAPDAINFRDWNVHLTDYFAGRGKMQPREVSEDARLDHEWIPVNDRIVLHFDGRRLDLYDATTAAKKLAEVTAQVWSDEVIGNMPPTFAR